MENNLRQFLHLSFGKQLKMSNTFDLILFCFFWPKFFFFIPLLLKLLIGMANSVDPVQTAHLGAVGSGSVLFQAAFAIFM